MLNLPANLDLPHESLIKLEKALQICHPLIGGVKKAVVMGSGWATLLEKSIPAMISVPFSELGWGDTHVMGHQNAVFYSAGLQTLIFGGRFHLYTGKTTSEVILPIIVAYALGAREIILTNAAGCVNLDFTVGQVVLIADHLNCTRRKIRLNQWNCDPVYSAECRLKMSDLLKNSGLACSEGVYAGVLGPAYETPSEAVAYLNAGADMIGMSTVLEAETAAVLGFKVLGLSLITNRIPLDFTQISVLTHEEVIGVAFAHLEEIFSVLVRYLTD